MRKLEGWVKSLSPTAEFLIVVIGTFALPIATSLSFSAYGDPAKALEIDDQGVHTLIAFEAIILLLLCWFLRVRGWSVEHFAAYPSWREMAHAAGLAVATWAAWLWLWRTFDPGMAEPVNNGLSWTSVLALSIINPLYEELILCAYMIPFLASRRGIGTALAVSLAVRLGFHTYQGALAMLAIGVFGLMMSAYYVRTRRLWPVLMAHGVLDFVALI